MTRSVYYRCVVNINNNIVFLYKFLDFVKSADVETADMGVGINPQIWGWGFTLFCFVL